MSQVIYIPRRNMVTTINYGALYNWYAATDSRKITSSDTWFVLNLVVSGYIQTRLGGGGISGGKLKEIGTLHWDYPNVGATNEYGFNGVGSGIRVKDGSFLQLKSIQHLLLIDIFIYNSNLYLTSALTGSNASFSSGGYTNNKQNGTSIRLFRNCTTEELSLPDGAVSATYTGNDGKIYRCCKIGNYIITADNLAETKFRNGDWITGFDGGTYTPISNSTWSRLTTGAMCFYNDVINNG